MESTSEQPLDVQAVPPEAWDGFEGNRLLSPHQLLERLYTLALAFFRNPSDPAINRVIIKLLFEVLDALETQVAAANNIDDHDSVSYITAMESSEEEVGGLVPVQSYYKMLTLLSPMQSISPSRTSIPSLTNASTERTTTTNYSDAGPPMFELDALQLGSWSDYEPLD